MTNEGKKPVNKPSGWHFKAEHIDDNGDIYSKGVFTGKNVNDLASGSKQPSEEKIPVQEDKKMDETNPVDIEALAKQIAEGLDAKYAERERLFQEQLKKEQEEFKASLSKTSPQVSGNMDVRDIAAAIAQANNYHQGGRMYTDVKDIDPEDYSKQGYCFTSYGNGYVIVDDVRNGKSVRTPYGRIFTFKFSASKITRIGRNQENYSSFCQFITHSKKEYEWLKEHSKFGIEFYEDAGKAIDTDAYKTTIISQVSGNINRMSQPQILDRAKAYGIPLGKSVDIIKGQVINHEVGLQVRAAEERMKNQFKEARQDAENAGVGPSIN